MDRPELTRLMWRKARRSADTGECVEVAAWRASRHSAATGSCVEVTPNSEIMLVRDSKDPDGPRLAFGQGAWRDFTDRIKSGAI